MTREPLLPEDVRTGTAYEAERAASRSHLLESAEQRRVALGPDLVLVFETRETIRASLEELLRAERVSDREQVAAETAAFAGLLAGDGELAATLYLDIADPAALADRLAELGDLGGAVTLEVSGTRVAARSEDAESGAGAWHLRFGLDEAQLDALVAGGPLTVVIDHPSLRADAVMHADQVRALTSDLRR